MVGSSQIRITVRLKSIGKLDWGEICSTVLWNYEKVSMSVHNSYSILCTNMLTFA